MGSNYDKLYSEGLLKGAPPFIKNNIHYEVMTGSVAYGCNRDNSDLDIYGWCIPPKDIIFPHSAGYIPGFAEEPPKFNQYQQHHIVSPQDKKEYDITIFSIIQWFNLVMENNPNMVDTLFVPRRCVLFSTQIGEHVRNNRGLFLHKGSFYKFRGYAYSQLHKMENKHINEWVKLCDRLHLPLDSEQEDLKNFNLKPEDEAESIKLIRLIDKDGQRTKRIGDIEKHGYSTKFAYHTVRLLLECMQILETGDLQLDRDREIYKAIRNGEWPLEKVKDFFDRNEKHLEVLYNQSTLRNRPDISALKKLLLECLEMHYGSLDKYIQSDNKYEKVIRQIQDVLSRL